MAEIRESILNIIHEIPWIVSRAKQYIEVFADSPELHRCNADVYVAIISALEAILQQCRQHIARKPEHFAHLVCNIPDDLLTLSKAGSARRFSDRI